MNREPQEQEELPAEAQEGQASAPPEELKPWYYQYWFLYPMIVFWPLWPVLILRSPWHNGLVSGALAWAMLISGSYIAYRVSGEMDAINRIQAGDQWALVTLQVIVPGLILTVITQIHWTMNRRRILDAPRQSPPAESPVSEPPESGRRRRSNRRRGRRRR